MGHLRNKTKAKVNPGEKRQTPVPCPPGAPDETCWTPKGLINPPIHLDHHHPPHTLSLAISIRCLQLFLADILWSWHLKIPGVFIASPRPSSQCYTVVSQGLLSEILSLRRMSWPQLLSETVHQDFMTTWVLQVSCIQNQDHLRNASKFCCQLRMLPDCLGPGLYHLLCLTLRKPSPRQWCLRSR